MHFHRIFHGVWLVVLVCLTINASAADLVVGPGELTASMYSSDENIKTAERVSPEDPLPLTYVSATGNVTLEAAQALYLNPGFSVKAGGVLHTDDGLSNEWELQFLGTLAYGPDDDPDLDGLTNLAEQQYGTHPLEVDTDNDGLEDGFELAMWGDDWDEDFDGDGLISLIDSDSDNDGLDDGFEVAPVFGSFTDPANADTDFDGMADGWEYDHGLNPLVDDANANNDNDDLTNYEEYLQGSDPLVPTEQTLTLSVDLIAQHTENPATIFSTWYMDTSTTPGQVPHIDDEKSVNLRAYRTIRLGPGIAGEPFKVPRGVRFTATVDDDLPNDWEMEQFGTLQYGPEDDPDHDGLPNRFEYLFGTNPSDTVHPDEDGNAPTVIVCYPADTETVVPQPIPDSEDASVELIVAFGDAGFGIKDVIILDGNNDPVTSNVVLTDNSAILTLINPEEGYYTYTIIISDYSGNTTEHEVAFTVEAPIQTTASPEGGSYSTDQTVLLTCNKPGAVIYYSTDGYPPTTSDVYSTGIAVNETLCLQFYAEVDGVKETLRKEIYYRNALPAKVENLEAVLTPAGDVELSWSSVAGADAYTVYRCKNAVEKKALEDSIAGSYPPPDRLILAQEITITPYTDDLPAEAVTRNYWYAVAAVDGEYTGVASDMASVSTEPSTAVATQAEAVSRAIAWLEANQYTEGFWSQGPWNPAPTDEEARVESLRSGRRMLFTSQATDVLLANSNPENVEILQAALYYLRGHHADNNDYLARTILSLAGDSQNVDMLVAKLIVGSRIDNDVVTGWGIQVRYDIDAVDTALGILAVEILYPEASGSNSKTETARYNLGQTTDLMSAGGTVAAPRYGWVPAGEDSVFASALVYKVLVKNTTTDQSIYQWIISGQNPDSSFGTGLADTAAALLWLDLPSTNKDAAIAYLVAQQETDGSWNSDTYLTALCARALMAE